MANTLVIFGASGDLTSRKLIPSLYSLFRKGRLPADTHIVGFSRSKFTSEEWRKSLEETTRKFTGRDFQQKKWDEFAPLIDYQIGDIDKHESFVALEKRLTELEHGEPATRIYYLATSPEFFEPAIEELGKSCHPQQGPGKCRIVIEKPFGTDRASAEHLNKALKAVFNERQVYRIDHYLGKETVQNILVFRFGNTIFEPVWNRNYIDHVQITVAEEVAVGRRGGYYDGAGVLRDMFQNHLLQLLAFTAMEPPARFDAESVRNEKVKVLSAVRPNNNSGAHPDLLLGQYQGYQQEPGVAPDSRTATFAALRLQIDNWRWQGVPFYLRAGKCMSCRTSQIVIQFRSPPHLIFEKKQREHEANRLVMHIQPAEGIQLHFQTKVPDAGMDMRMTSLDFRYQQQFEGELPDAYERLLMDVMIGDQSLFARSDEVELAWGIMDPLTAAAADKNGPRVTTYERGLWGPEESLNWMREDGREWLDSCPVLT